jgi:CRISPR-associated protein Csx3
MTDATLDSLRLQLSPPGAYQGLSCQWLTIELLSQDRIITPDILADLSLPSGIDTRGGVVITGRAPIWLYAYLVHELHPTAWVACYDPRLGAVVVSTHSHQTQIGQVLPLDPQPHRHRLGPALMVVGPPNSGKSLLCHALFQALLPTHPNVYLQRAHWDGEGNWILELNQATEADRETFKRQYKGQLSSNFFPNHARSILQLRRQKDLVIVDVGGKVQPEKQPILEACSHFLIISSQPEEIDHWYEFCHDRGNLAPVAIVHSLLDAGEVIHLQEPYLEISWGPWLPGQVTLPAVLLSQVKRLLPCHDAIKSIPG